MDAVLPQRSDAEAEAGLSEGAHRNTPGRCDNVGHGRHGSQGVYLVTNSVNNIVVGRGHDLHSQSSHHMPGLVVLQHLIADLSWIGDGTGVTEVQWLFRLSRISTTNILIPSQPHVILDVWLHECGTCSLSRGYPLPR